MKASPNSTPKRAEAQWTYRAPDTGAVVEIDPELVRKYEATVGPFTENKPEYFFITSDCPNPQSPASVKASIEESIREEIEVYSRKDEVLSQIAELEKAGAESPS